MTILNKIITYRDNITKENQRDLRRDIEWILEIVAFERELILIVEDITLLILSVSVLTENFTVEGLIKKAYKFIYKSLIKEGNYLGANSTENPLISYLAVPTRRKKKSKLLSVSSSLIVPEESKDSILLLLPQYNIQITGSLESQLILLSLYNINNSLAFQ